MATPFAVIFCAFLLSDFHKSFVCGADKNKGSDNELQQQLLNLLVSQNRRFELLESRNRELQATFEKQTKQMSHVVSNIKELQETIVKQRQQLDDVYKILNENTEHENDKRTETYVKDRKDQKKRLLVGTLAVPVAFQAYLSRAQTNPNGHQTIIFDNVELNVGNGYHHTSGIFVAPEAGIYAFSWSIRLFGNASHSAQLMVGDQEYDGVYLSVRNGDNENVSGTAVAQLERGQDVFVRTHAAFNYGDIHSDPLGRSSFCGWRVN